MKDFHTPEMNIQTIMVEDVITTSTGNGAITPPTPED